MRIRLLVHALDRTGPPMLALGFAQWLRANEPGHTISTVAFRGGELLDDFVRLGPVQVLLDPQEAWNHGDPDPGSVKRAKERGSDLADADVSLLVSVSAAQALRHLGHPTEHVVTWVVEQGEDLHWIDDEPLLSATTTRWLAGSVTTREELSGVVASGTDIGIAPEFIADTSDMEDATVGNCRRMFDVPDDGLLVMDAGIATHRKAPDLFLELALRAERDPDNRDRFVWLGGERDDGYWRIHAEVARLGLANIRLLGNVTDVTPWLAAADVVAHVARLDAFPLVCLHAASVGTPVIGFAGVGGLEEMFGSTGRYVPFPDLAAMAETIDDLRDPVLRDSVGGAQRGATSRFRATSAAPVLLQHLEDIVGTGAPSGGER